MIKIFPSKLFSQLVFSWFGFLLVLLAVPQSREMEWIDLIFWLSTFIYLPVLFIKKKFNIPPAFFWLSGCWLIISSIATFFSRVPSESIAQVLQELAILLHVVVFHATIGSSTTLRWKFYELVVAFVSVLSLLSLILLIFPFWTPESDLIIFFPRYGHNQVASFILFIAPLFLHLKTRYKKKSWLFWIAGILMILAFVTSMSRGSWLTAIIISVFLFYRRQDTFNKFARLGLLSLTVMFSTLVVLPSWLYADGWRVPMSQLQNHPWLRLVYKPIQLEGRWAYWQIAWKGWLDRPFWGHGPATFEYIARLYQTNVGHFSEYAHSWILQVLSERGVWAGIWFLAIVLCLSRVKSNQSFLGWSLLIAFLEIQTDFISEYVLFQFLTLIFLLNYLSDTSKFGRQFATEAVKLVLLVSITVLSSYSIGWIMVTRLPIRCQLLRFYPICRNQGLETTQYWFQSDPEYWENQADTYLSADEEEKSLKAIQKALELDSGNESLLKSFIRANQDTVSLVLLKQPFEYRLVKFKLTQSEFEAVMNLYDDIIKTRGVEISTEYLDNVNFGSSRERFEISKMFYLYALEWYQLGDQDAAQASLSLAHQLTPYWSHFAIELAALYWELGKPNLTRVQLENCLLNQVTQQHCQQYYNQLQETQQMPILGSLRQEIENL